MHHCLAAQQLGCNALISLKLLGMHGSPCCLQACSRGVVVQHSGLIKVITCSHSTKLGAWSVLAPMRHQRALARLAQQQNRKEMTTISSPPDNCTGLHLQLANSAAAAIAAMALLVSPVGVSAVKRSAVVTPSTVEMTASSSSGSKTGSMLTEGRILATCAGSCSITSTASDASRLEAAGAELQPVFMSPVGQALIVARQLVFVVEDVVQAVTDLVVNCNNINTKQLGLKCRWLQQLLGSRRHVRLLVLCALVLLGYIMTLLVGLIAPWANQHAAPGLRLLLAQGIMHQ